MPIGDHYTDEEWQVISGAASFDAVDAEQLGRLHRYWIWADHAKRAFDEARRTEGWDDYEDWGAQTPWAMYVWYGLLYVVLAGYDKRRIVLKGQLRDDLRRVREPLRNARNAAFHVEEDRDYFEHRLTDILDLDPARIWRVHQALGQLLLNEVMRRRAASAEC